MKPVSETLQISRSNLSDRKKGPYRKEEDLELLPKIRSLVDERPSYGYCRIHRLLVRMLTREGKEPVNHKRVYRIMKQHHLLLPRHAGVRVPRVHEVQNFTEGSHPISWDGSHLISS